MTDSEKLDLLLVGMEGMQGDIAALKNGQKEIRKDVKKLTQKVEDTYQIALEAWGLSNENRAQLTT